MTSENLHKKFLNCLQRFPTTQKFLVRQTEDPDRLADIIIINLNIENEEKQELLETIDVRKTRKSTYPSSKKSTSWSCQQTSNHRAW